MLERLPACESPKQPSVLRHRLTSVHQAVRKLAYAAIACAAFVSPRTTTAEEPVMPDAAMERRREESFEEWAQRQSRIFDPAHSKDVMKILRRMDAEDFSTRIAAERDLFFLYPPLLREMNPPPEACMKMFPDESPGNETPHPRYSPQVRTALQNIRRRIERHSFEHSEVIPAGEYEWRECMELIEHQTGFIIRYPLEAESDMADMTIAVQEGTNNCYDVLEQACRMAKLEPQLGDMSDVIRCVMNVSWAGRILHGNGYLCIQYGKTLHFARTRRRGALIEIDDVEVPKGSGLVGKSREIQSLMRFPFGQILPQRVTNEVRGKETDGLSHIRMKCLESSEPITVRHQLEHDPIVIGDQCFVFSIYPNEGVSNVCMWRLTKGAQTLEEFSAMDVRDKAIHNRMTCAASFRFLDKDGSPLKQGPTFLQTGAGYYPFLSVLIEGQPRYVDITADQGLHDMITVEIPYPAKDEQP